MPASADRGFRTPSEGGRRNPNFTEHRDQHLTDGPHRKVCAFDVGLDLILAGLRPMGRT
jgi:hypothetical protein